MNIILTEKKPIKMWLDDIDENALDQAKNLANLPFVFRHIAIMPDSHMGYGMPIGGVLATRDIIVPNAVGVDIGCGMCAIRTSLTEIDTDTLKKIMGEIRKVVPVGFSKHRDNQDCFLLPEREKDCPEEEPWINSKKYPIVAQEFENALKSLGTLGGGNHFIEIQKGDDGYIWIMIHSGSRNIGLQVANHYNKLAIEMNERYYSQVPKEWELAFLRVDTEEGQAYMNEMNYCVDFALANRKLMMDRIKQLFAHHTDCRFDDMLNIAHNYASLENHFGRNVFIHRKGATSAKDGEIGIIPGSMGAASYIVEGLGNRESFKSCSHGAGRKMGRKQAIRELNLEDEQAKMGDTIGKPRGQNDLDEAPGAYKNIDTVMANQTDLVKVITKLKPLAVIKG